MRPDLPALLDPATTALLVIDVQNDYAHPDGALGRIGIDMSTAVEMIPRLQRVVDAARAAGVYVVFTRNWHRDATDSEAWSRRIHRTITPEQRPGVAGSWGAEFTGVLPLPGEEIVSKARYDAFLNTNLELLLRARGIRTVVCTGTATNVCVESTARAAHMRDFNLVLIGDCCATGDQRLHEATLTNIQVHFGEVVGAEAVLDAWTGVPTAVSGRAAG